MAVAQSSQSSDAAASSSAGGGAAPDKLVFAYQAALDFIQTPNDLLKYIERPVKGAVPTGVPEAAVGDCYDGIRDDIVALIRSGALIAVRNRDTASLVLFERGPAFLTELSGDVQCAAGSRDAASSQDLRAEASASARARRGSFGAGSGRVAVMNENSEAEIASRISAAAGRASDWSSEVRPPADDAIRSLRFLSSSLLLPARCDAATPSGSAARTGAASRRASSTRRRRTSSRSARTRPSRCVARQRCYWLWEQRGGPRDT